MIAKESFWVIIVYMETNNSSKLPEKAIPLNQIIRMEELLGKYFLEYFLPREDRQKVQHTESKDYLSYKEDNLLNRHHYSSNFDLYKIPSKNEVKKSSRKNVAKVLKKYIDDDYCTFDIAGFVRNEIDYFGLLPNDMHSVDGEKLSSMIQEFNECKDLTSTFTQICLEKLFDNQFREEFDKKTNNAFKAEEATNIVNDFVKLCKENYSYTFSSDILEWNFSIFDYVKETRKRKYGDENNIFSTYKLYGQGEYSKLLIAFRKNSNKSLNELKKEGIKPILEDEVKIGEYDKVLSSINDLFNKQKERIKQFQQKLNIIKDEKYRSIIESKIENENRIPIKIGEFLCKRFNDFIPLEMDEKYNTVHPNKTLREELFELYKYNSNRVERKVPLNSSECETVKKLFINLVNEYGIEKCKEITGDRLFENYSFEDLNTKEALRKRHIPIMVYCDILEVFENKGYIKDGRSNDKSLQSFKEIKNKLSLHNTIREYYVEYKNGGEKSIFDDVDEKKNDYKREYETDFEEIDYENVAPFCFLQRRIEFLFKNRTVLKDDLKTCLYNHNMRDKILVFDPSEKNKYEKIDIVKRAIKKLCRNYDSKIESFFNKKTEDGKKIVLCRYKHHASERNGTYSLETVLNIDDTLMEKIWFSIFLEDLKGDERNPWRRLTNNCYLNEIPEDERKAVGDSIKQSMKNIYESFLKYDF